MPVDKDTLNPADYPKHDDDEDLNKQDRGDNGLEEDDEPEEDKPETKKPAKKPAKKEETPADDEDEPEEDDEEEEEEDEPEEDKKSTQVPLRVLQKAQQKRHAAEQRVADLEARLRTLEQSKSDRQKDQFEKLTTRMDELYEQVEEARAVGKSKEAAKLQRELDEIRGKMTSAQASMLATRQALEAQNLQAYNALVAELEVRDPRFDKDDDTYDEDLVERVGELTEAYEARGANAPDALRKALRLILGSDPFKAARQLQRDEKAVEKKAEPRKTDVKKNVAAAKKQPPADSDAHKELDGRIDSRKLTEEDFDKLPKSKLRELRGDFG